MKKYIRLAILIFIVLLIISANIFVIYTIGSKFVNFMSEHDNHFDTDHYKKYIQFKYGMDID